jgi:SAM-dependent methyltransferase
VAGRFDIRLDPTTHLGPGTRKVMTVDGGLVERTTCPVCRAPAERAATLSDLPFDQDPLRRYLSEFYDGALDVRPLRGERFVLLDCPGCGLVYQRHVPDAALLEQLYGSAALADAGAVGAARGLSTRIAYAHDVERVIRHVGLPAAQIEVLDFGSGTGLWLQMAAAFGCRTTGAEITGSTLERLSAAGHRAVSMEDLPSERFHFVNTEQVVEHLVEPAETVQRLAAALRPGGVLRISVPNGSDIRERLRRGDWSAPKGSAESLNPVAPLEHLNCFDAASLRRLGTGAGLRPFDYPLRVELHQLGRLRYIAGAVRGRVRRPTGTLQLFSKP